MFVRVVFIVALDHCFSLPKYRIRVMHAQRLFRAVMCTKYGQLLGDFGHLKQPRSISSPEKLGGVSAFWLWAFRGCARGLFQAMFKLIKAAKLKEAKLQQEPVFIPVLSQRCVCRHLSHASNTT